MANIVKSTTHIYHLCSEGSRTDVLFHDTAEFVSGMNIVAIAVLKSSIVLLAFCLMDNHFHFILKSQSDEEVTQFATSLSQLYKRRMSGKYPAQEPIRWAFFHIDTESYLKYAIAYTIKNPTSAHYRKLSLYYPWASSNLYFNEETDRTVRLSGYRTIRELGNTKTREILKSRHDFPADWYVTPHGYIWPGNYVSVQEVENLYEDPRQFLFYLSATKKENVQEMTNQLRRICIPDQEMRKHAMDMCMENFHHRVLTDLGLPERQSLQRQLIRRFGCAEKQIARILHLHQEQ